MKKNIYVIGDTQVRPGVKNPLLPVAFDIINTYPLPDFVVHLGDHWDMPSLSAYDFGKISFTGRRYIADINAGDQAMFEFWSVIELGRQANPEWKCKFVFCKGNHEDRIRKAMEMARPEFQGLLEMHQPDLIGWDVVKDFLDPYVIGGVCFVHYMANEFTSRAISTARAALKAKHSSFVCGHKQVLDYAEEQTISGKRIMGLIMGACYFHNETYKGPQNNKHFRGTVILRNVEHGEWEMQVRNLKTLEEEYK